MAGKNNQEKWRDINYRQKKVAAQARIILGLPAEVKPDPKWGRGKRLAPVVVGLDKPMIRLNSQPVLKRRGGWEYFVMNQFKAFRQPKVEVAIAADNSNVVKKGGPFSSHYNFQQRLEKKGYKFIGSGNFSNVYAKDGSDKVLKITHNLSDSWFYYAKWANENGWGGKYAPKMYSHKFFKEGKFAVAVMERLQPRTYEGTNPHVVWEVLSRYSGNPTANTLLDLAAPGLPKFMEDAKKRFHFDDDHGQNLMVRSDGTLVWNDPVAWGAEKTANDNIETRLRFAA